MTIDQVLNKVNFKICLPQILQSKADKNQKEKKIIDKEFCCEKNRETGTGKYGLRKGKRAMPWRDERGNYYQHGLSTQIKG